MSVTEAPHGNPYASRDVKTRSNHGLVLLGLRLKRARIGRKVLDTDVELSVGDVEAESRVLVQRPS